MPSHTTLHTTHDTRHTRIPATHRSSFAYTYIRSLSLGSSLILPFLSSPALLPAATLSIFTYTVYNPVELHVCIKEVVLPVRPHSAPLASGPIHPCGGVNDASFPLLIGLASTFGSAGTRSAEPARKIERRRSLSELAPRLPRIRCSQSFGGVCWSVTSWILSPLPSPSQ